MRKRIDYGMKKFKLRQVDYGQDLPAWIEDRIRLGLYVRESATGDIWNISHSAELAWELVQWKATAKTI